MSDWITSAEVAAYLGPLAVDTQRVADSTDASKQFVEDRRSDLGLADLADGEKAPADVHLGAVIYAAIVYQARVSPTGFAAYGDGALDIPGDQQAAYMRAMRLIGLRKPMAI